MALPRIHYVIVGKGLNQSGSISSHIKLELARDNKSISFVVLLGGLSEIMLINYSTQILTQGKCLISVSFYNETKALVGMGDKLLERFCLLAFPTFQESREPKFCYRLNRRPKQTK